MNKSTKPDVFIIESLNFNDEENERFEGRIISNILHLNSKRSKYYYIRTKKELESVVDIFAKSRFRYLHLSCHGSSNSMSTTLDTIPFEVLGKIINPHINNKRIFISSCRMANMKLAETIIPNSSCFSIMGPVEKIGFSDAAILWASFYHLLFSYDPQSIKRTGLDRYLQNIVNLYEIPLNYFSSSRETETGYKLKKVVPM